MPVSAVDCVQPAIQHTRDQLFRPFRFGQWVRLALVGFLAAELHTSGCSVPNFNIPVAPSHRRGDEFLSTPFPHIDPSHIAQMAGLIAAVIVLALILFVVFLYLNSVFRFILFDSVIKKRCSISEGWSRWQRAGRRYFLWQIVLIIAQGLFAALLLGVPLLIAFALGWFRDVQHHIARTVIGAILLIGLLIIFALAAAAVQLLAKDFLVPIMALEEMDFADGWSRLMSLIRPEKGRFAIYLLLKIVLSIAAAILFGIITLIPILVLVVPAVIAVFAGYKAGLTWNVATISLAIILGSVLFAVLMFVTALISVPATVFFPAFSIHFFAARYPKLDALLNPPPPAPEVAPIPTIEPPHPEPSAPPSVEPPSSSSPEPPSPEPPPLPPTPEPIG